jgi:hypothetical protein
MLWLAVAVTAGSAPLPPAGLKLPSFFSDNLVLPRDTAMVLYWWQTDGNEPGSVDLQLPGLRKPRNWRSSFDSAQGCWTAKLDLSDFREPGPGTLTFIERRNAWRYALENVVLGDVYLVFVDLEAGVTPLDRSLVPEATLQRQARFSTWSLLDKKNLAMGGASPWRLCRAAEVANSHLTSVAYHLAALLVRNNPSVPVGVIQAPAALWTWAENRFPDGGKVEGESPAALACARAREEAARVALAHSNHVVRLKREGITTNRPPPRLPLTFNRMFEVWDSRTSERLADLPHPVKGLLWTKP